MAEKLKLEQGLNLWQAVAINMIDMVGIGPFVALPFVMGYMQGPACIIAWLLGALLSFMDGAVWAELGARWPQAGGSYVFLQNIYGKEKWGRLMAFLFVWQTTIQAPLVIASGAIGFSQYITYLIPHLSSIEQKAVSGLLVVFVTVLLYRKIGSIGKLSMIMGLIVMGTIGWIIVSGFTHFNSAMALTPAPGSLALGPLFFMGLGLAGTKTIYSYLGYYNVCHLGGEIKQPERNIPRSIFISIAGIAIFYILMQVSILGALPWQQAQHSPFIVSMLFERLYGERAAQIATGLVLLIAISSLFAVMLGYSRIPYAAALDGNFFPIFSRLHPQKHFPYVSLLVLAAIAFAFSLMLKLGEVITAIVVMRIIVQFVGQSVGLIGLHYQRKTTGFPYKMFLFPLPPLIAIIVWLFLFFNSRSIFIYRALGFIGLGIILFLALSAYQKRWPFVKRK